jgi:cell division protein FtsW
LLFATFFMVAFGLVMIFNASLPISLGKFKNPHFLFYRQLLWTGIGLFLFFIATQVPLRILKSKEVMIGLLILTYVLLALVFTQSPINGTRRWIHMAGVSLQPSELAKLTVILFLAWYVNRFGDLSVKPVRHLLCIVAVIGPMALLILREPDLGNTVILLSIAAILMFFGGFPVRYITVLGVVTIPILVTAVLMSSYMMDRINTFLDAGADPLGRGYHIKQSLIAVGHTGFWGAGLGQSTQKLFFLPEPHTDFIFAVVAEEMGFIGCMLLVLLFGYLFMRGMKISLRSKSSFTQCLGAGAVTLLVIQALINISMVVHLMPTKGIPLPFISMGGTSLIASLLSVGLVLNISREVPEC